MRDTTTLAVCLLAFGLIETATAADATLDHLIPESGPFSDHSYEYSLWVRRQLVERAADRPDFQVVVLPSFGPEWMITGNSKSNQLTLIRVEEKIGRAPERVARVTTHSKQVPPALMRRLRVLIVNHLAAVRPDANSVEDIQAGEAEMTKIVVRADGIGYSFAARAINGTATLTGTVGHEGPAITALTAVVNVAADIANAKDGRETEQALSALEKALTEAEALVPGIR